LKTDLDDTTPQETYDQLEADYDPKDFIAKSLLFCVANNYCRLLRAYKAEAMYVKEIMSLRGGVTRSYKSEKEHDQYRIALAIYDDLKSKADLAELGSLHTDEDVLALKPKEPEYEYSINKDGYVSKLKKDNVEYLMSTLARYCTTMENRYYKSLRVLLDTKT
jgi:hypothetical protein